MTTGGTGAIGLVAQSIGGGSADTALPLSPLAVRSEANGGGAGGRTLWFSTGGTGGTGGEAPPPRSSMPAAGS